MEGGVLGQLHRKPSIPKLLCTPTVTIDTHTTIEKDNKTPVTNNHTYSSPMPKPISASGTQIEVTNDHTYAENSNVPTEPYDSDSDSKLDAVSTGVTPGGIE